MHIFKSVKWYRNCQPIGIIGASVLVYKFGKIYLLTDDKMTVVANLKLDFRQLVEERISLLRRLFRREIRCSCITINNDILFFRCGVLYNFNVQDKVLKEVWRVKHRYSTPLNLTTSRTISYIALWGDYFSNDKREQVNIYGLTVGYDVKVLYTFPTQTIRHIHNIVPDNRDGYYIFAGDDDEMAGIYHADSDFADVEPIYIGDRQARAVVGFAYKDGLLFATDSVNELNHLYNLYKRNDVWIKDEISQMNGSCIYGVKYKDKYLFSTVVESPESDGSIWSLLSRKLGTGIRSDNVEIVSVDESLQVKVEERIKKDKLPYKLFQYGSVRFVSDDISNIFCIYPVAVRKYDSKLGVIRGL